MRRKLWVRETFTSLDEGGLAAFGRTKHKVVEHAGSRAADKARETMLAQDGAAEKMEMGPFRKSGVSIRI
jgi:hypothetical protein